MKKSIKYLLISLLTFTLLSSQNLNAKNTGVSIAIKKGTVSINGKKFNSGKSFTMEGVKKILGAPSRVKEGYNILHTYDNLGIVFFEDSKEKTINEVQLSFTLSDSYDHSPKSAYTGSFNLEKLKIGTATSLAKVQDKLKAYSFVKSLLDDNSYRGEANGIYVYVRFAAGDNSSIKISFGFKK